MNAGLALLQPYPFERLATLLRHSEPALNPVIPLTVGEPQHPPPDGAVALLQEHALLVAKYPATQGRAQLRAAIAQWLAKRFGLSSVDPEHHVLPLNGTREGLFALAQAVDLVTSAQWQSCQLVYLCTPGNPGGAVMSSHQLQRLITLAHEHNFLIASDECYSEIYPDEAAPPTGLLEAAAAMGNTEFRHCLCFHSLSKRSNLPGLRSGFVAGDPDWIGRFRRYRTYHGCAMPLHHQIASEWAWGDEAHVVANRARYRQKFEAVAPILSAVLPTPKPDAGFYLWPQTPVDDERFAQKVYERAGVSLLPGSYLARETTAGNPGAMRVRIALVAELSQCVEAAERIADCLRQGW